MAKLEEEARSLSNNQKKKKMSQLTNGQTLQEQTIRQNILPFKQAKHDFHQQKQQKQCH